MQQYGLSDLLGRIERESKCIQWALAGLQGQSKRLFIERRMASLKTSYARLNERQAEQETELLAAVKPTSVFPPAVEPQEQKREDTSVKSRDAMSQARKQARLSYATWIYAMTRMPVGPAQAKVATRCFQKLEAYHSQLKEIVGEDQATEILTEVFNEVHAAMAGEQPVEAEQEQREMVGVEAQLE